MSVGGTEGGNEERERRYGSVSALPVPRPPTKFYYGQRAITDGQVIALPLERCGLWGASLNSLAGYLRLMDWPLDVTCTQCRCRCSADPGWRLLQEMYCPPIDCRVEVCEEEDDTQVTHEGDCIS